MFIKFSTITTKQLQLRKLFEKFSNIDEILSKQEEWIGNPAALIYHKLSKETKQHVTVALNVKEVMNCSVVIIGIVHLSL